MIEKWLVNLAVIVVIATIPISVFYAFYYDNAAWFIPAAIALAIVYAAG